ncbi:MAG TPA: ABC transporter ATP-binding protein [Chitinophagaceae bacterium]|nr:ABC transporter ATP-binding protein [Chitinophagaceae bacterium]
MPQTVIKVEDVGKKYIIGHQGKGGYKTFREQAMQHAHNFYSRTRQLIIGRTVIEGDEVEEFWALKDLNFEIQQGDRVGIIGRNGAGKSTLLKVLSRITEPTTGRISIKGRVASLLEVGTGFHPELTGRENIFLNGAIMGMSRAEIKRKFDEIVDFSGVEKFLDTPVKRYSSGMYVRLAFSVAAHLEPEILVIDEVLAVGDAEFQKKCLGKMQDVSESEGRTVLFVSHNMAALQSLCNKSMVLSQGKISLPLTSTAEAIAHYLEKIFIRSESRIAERKDRSGLGEIRIVDFKMTNNRGEVQPVFISGQKAIFKLYFQCVKNVSSLNLSAAISFTNSEGLLVTVLASEFLNFYIKTTADHGCITCAIDKLPFSNGQYSMNIILRNHGIIQDWIKEADIIDIESGDYFGTGRIVEASHKSLLLEQTWDLE